MILYGKIPHSKCEVQNQLSHFSSYLKMFRGNCFKSMISNTFCIEHSRRVSLCYGWWIGKFIGKILQDLFHKRPATIDYYPIFCFLAFYSHENVYPYALGEFVVKRVESGWGGAGGELAYLLEVIFTKLYLRSPCCHLLLTQVLWRSMCYRTRSF